jgi:hypothetical protein
MVPEIRRPSDLLPSLLAVAPPVADGKSTLVPRERFNEILRKL